VSREAIEKLATQLVHIAYEIHSELGPGLFESVYEEVFCLELKKKNISFKRQQPIDIFYKEHRVEKAFTCDIFVDEMIIIELKSVTELHPIHFKQLGTYLKLTGIKLGLLINFNEGVIKVRRVANNL
jgi:GxxExxY protein